MTAKGDLAVLSEHAERRLDAAFAPAAVALGRAGAADGPGPMTHERARSILWHADTVLDALYGRRRGDPSPVLAIIEGHGGLSYATPARREADRIAADLIDRGETVLLAALLGEGGG